MSASAQTAHGEHLLVCSVDGDIEAILRHAATVAREVTEALPRRGRCPLTASLTCGKRREREEGSEDEEGYREGRGKKGGEVTCGA